ncbi:MAG: ribulose-phosphate 3-epimerase [Rubrobacteraceae bacterium]|nr:ribulose-phosphate 3-epimerase [Rubrobacteraceae bacterium]
MTYFGQLGNRVVGAPSILAADFANLAEEVRRAQRGGASLVHFDVMDNHFVPNLTVGPAVATSLAAAVDLPIDAHLQMTNPDSLIPQFIEAGVASICVQPESATHLHRTLDLIQSGGCEAGVALSPTTPPELIEWALPYIDYVNVMSVNPGFGGQDFIPEMADKVRQVKEMTNVPIAVDGGITKETAPLMAEAGAQVLIAGSAVFKADPATEMRSIIEAGEEVSH